MFARRRTPISNSNRARSRVTSGPLSSSLCYGNTARGCIRQSNLDFSRRSRPMSVLHVQYERASDLQLQQLTTAVGARSVLCSGTVDHRRRTLHHHQLHCTDRDETRRLLLLRCRSSTASSQSPGDLCRRRSPLLQLTTRMWPRFGLGAFILRPSRR